MPRRLFDPCFLFIFILMILLMAGRVAARAQCPMDFDGDQYISVECGGTDCDDHNYMIHPGATEIIGDGIDEDCDGFELCYEDLDGDGWTSTTSTVLSSDFSCSAFGPFGPGDCDDSDPTINPAALDIPGDGIDQDCDGMDATAVPSPRSSWGMLKGSF